jgi:hypothetical protein
MNFLTNFENPSSNPFQDPKVANEVDTGEHRQITEKEILRRVSVSIFKISKAKTPV